MLSYVFKNKKMKPIDIERTCINEFSMCEFRKSGKVVFLTNDNMDVIITKRYTHITLANEKINIKKLQDMF